MVEQKISPMEQLLKQHGLTLPKVGETIQGQLIAQKGNAIFIDLGNFRTGIVYGREFYLAKELIKTLNPGDMVSAKILEIENDEGYMELSIAQVGIGAGWEKLTKLKEQKEVLSVKIEEANRGGLLATIEGQKAFMPVSQLTNEHYPRIEGSDKTKILEELQKFVGTNMDVRIIDVDPNVQKLIISERATQNELLESLLKNYKVGDVIEGEISGVTDFGAFVKFTPTTVNPAFAAMPLEGLVHISELDWQLIEDPRTIVKVGDTVKAKIISIEEGRISLSMKALKKDSWADIETKFKKGDVVPGTLMKFNSFGAFINLGDTIHGLAHISEFGSEKKMKESLQEGKAYRFKILNVEAKEHRMSLGFFGE